MCEKCVEAVEQRRFRVVTMEDGTEFNIIRDTIKNEMSVVILTFRKDGTRMKVRVHVENENDWHDVFHTIDEDWLKENLLP